MALATEERIHLIVNDFTFGLAEAPTDTLGTFTWTDGTDKIAFHHSTTLGTAILELIVLPFNECSGTGTPCGTDTEIPLPPLADPPFPPVWPYTWDSSLIYGREKLAQTHKFIREDTYKFDANVIFGDAPLDITGYTVVLTAKWNLKDAASVFTCTVGDGLTIPTPANGVVQVVIAGIKTEGLPSHEVILPFDMQITSPTGERSTVLYGNFKIFPDATLS